MEAQLQQRVLHVRDPASRHTDNFETYSSTVRCKDVCHFKVSRKFCLVDRLEMQLLLNSRTRFPLREQTMDSQCFGSVQEPDASNHQVILRLPAFVQIDSG